MYPGSPKHGLVESLVEELSLICADGTLQEFGVRFVLHCIYGVLSLNYLYPYNIEALCFASYLLDNKVLDNKEELFKNKLVH